MDLLFPDLPVMPVASPPGIRATRRAAQWRESLTRAWSYWRGKATSEHEAARLDAAYERELAAGPDFAKHHSGSDFAAPVVRLDGNDIAKLMALYRGIERGSYKARAKGKHGGAIGRAAMRVLEAFLFVLYRPGKPLCVPYEAIAAAAMVSRRTVADALKRLASLGVITIHRRVKRIRTELGFKVCQDCNAYELHPPRGFLGAFMLAVFGPQRSECSKCPANGTAVYSKKGTEAETPPWGIPDGIYPPDEEGLAMVRLQDRDRR